MKYKYPISFYHYNGMRDGIDRHILEIDDLITTDDHIKTIEDDIKSRALGRLEIVRVLSFSLMGR